MDLRLWIRRRGDARGPWRPFLPSPQPSVGGAPPPLAALSQAALLPAALPRRNPLPPAEPPSADTPLPSVASMLGCPTPRRPHSSAAAPLGGHTYPSAAAPSLPALPNTKPNRTERTHRKFGKSNIDFQKAQMGYKRQWQYILIRSHCFATQRFYFTSVCPGEVCGPLVL